MRKAESHWRCGSARHSRHRTRHVSPYLSDGTGGLSEVQYIDVLSVPALEVKQQLERKENMVTGSFLPRQHFNLEAFLAFHSGCKELSNHSSKSFANPELSILAFRIIL